MRIFKDYEGQEWQLDVNVATLLAIKTELGLDLLESPDKTPTSLSKMVDILYVTLHSQLQEAGLNEHDFALRLQGDCLANAIDLWMEELGSFFLKVQPSKGVAVKGLWAKCKELDAMEAANLESLLGSVSLELPGSQD